MRASTAVLLVALLAPVVSHAETFACVGEAKGAAGEAIVRVDVIDGKPSRGLLIWSPPGDNPQRTGLRLTRAYRNVQSGDLGPVDVLQVMTIANINPSVDRAVIGVSSDTAKPIFKDWSLYGEQMRKWKSEPAGANLPDGAKAVAFAGSVPFKRFEEGAAALLDSLDAARTVIISATDPKGEVLLQRGLFVLTDRSGAATLEQQARAKAMEAAEAPATACKKMP